MMFGEPWSMERMTFPPFVFFLTVVFGVMVVFALAWLLPHYNLKVTFWSHVSHEVGVTSAAGTA